MEYRKLPHGTEREKFSVLGLGMGGIGLTPPEEIEAIVRKAMASISLTSAPPGPPMRP